MVCSTFIYTYTECSVSLQIQSPTPLPRSPSLAYCDWDNEDDDSDDDYDDDDKDDDEEDDDNDKNDVTTKRTRENSWTKLQSANLLECDAQCRLKLCLSGKLYFKIDKGMYVFCFCFFTLLNFWWILDEKRPFWMKAHHDTLLLQKQTSKRCHITVKYWKI